MKKDHSRRNEIIVLIVFNVIVAALFIADWARHGMGSDAKTWLPATDLFSAWLFFFVPSIIQLALILMDWPAGTVLVSVLRTLCYGFCCGLLAALVSYNDGAEITGESYGNIIMAWLALGVGIIAFVLDIVFCAARIRRSKGTAAGYSKAEKTWLACGIIAAMLWFFMSMTYNLSASRWVYAAAPAVIYIAVAIAWWIASRRSRAGSVILFLLLSVCAGLSMGAVYQFCINEGSIYVILAVLEIAAFIVWYVFTCILYARRWKAKALAAA